ncbi:MAG: signal peptidase II [Paracoccaceae bacterium]|jgi:signal peptidase II|uniref:signal peptidase II n=1 Tax=unclassified Seohaeicola TaxID=2641111 RepID=UPI00237B1AF1|nr:MULTISPECIES: signal peptidase II [unclassified Seohaeicola]MDD9706552.1 signal peptidase II [Seohaeicola sp. 4SK31]MDD9734258.1 signal peptidase II [Seohaeicola sp. SP36]MDF1706657.1 signal peptidase II [Paracoccaceae bacterium]MDM7968396.1 signal peptidase II [Paracoccaceae bacterium]
MRLVFWVALAIFVADQAVKYLVVHLLDLAYLGAIDVFPPYLNLRMAWNYGINFGLFAQASDLARWLLITVALVISGGVLWWVRRDPPGRWGLISAGLLVGGALGNVVDRVLYGAVADFLNMSCCGIENPYAFNIADISIFAGAIGLVLFTPEKKAP